MKIRASKILWLRLKINENNVAGSIKYLSVSLMEESFSKYKSAFENIRDCHADFKESERRTAYFEDSANITVDGVSLNPH